MVNLIGAQRSKWLGHIYRAVARSNIMEIVD